MHEFKTEQFLPITKEKAWEFFSSPKNLSLITPPQMEFKILSDLRNEFIYEGMKINYSVKPLWGIPVMWQTEISAVHFEKSFTDRQTIGPYKIWEHTHTFVEKKKGILMIDELNYLLRFGIFGKLIERLIVRRKIMSIFDYRKRVLEKMFN